MLRDKFVSCVRRIGRRDQRWSPRHKVQGIREGKEAGYRASRFAVHSVAQAQVTQPGRKPGRRLPANGRLPVYVNVSIPWLSGSTGSMPVSFVGTEIRVEGKQKSPARNIPPGSVEHLYCEVCFEQTGCQGNWTTVRKDRWTVVASNVKDGTKCRLKYSTYDGPPASAPTDRARSVGCGSVTGSAPQPIVGDSCSSQFRTRPASIGVDGRCLAMTAAPQPQPVNPPTNAARSGFGTPSSTPYKTSKHVHNLNATSPSDPRPTNLMSRSAHRAVDRRWCDGRSHSRKSKSRVQRPGRADAPL